MDSDGLVAGMRVLFIMGIYRIKNFLDERCHDIPAMQTMMMIFHSFFNLIRKKYIVVIEYCNEEMHRSSSILHSLY